MDYGELSLKAHERSKGKISIESRMPLETKYDLSIAYTPGVAEPCRQIHADPENAYKYTSKGNLVAVVSDGSAVLGLGNIGPEASLPVMEGKAVLFKRFAGVDAVPIVLSTQDPEEIIETVKRISPGFGGINLEDIAAPQCFMIEQRLKKELPIPVLHDDQHGTAIVTLAGMINALRLTERQMSEVKVVINGTGAAGISIIKLLIECGVKEVVMVDSKGIIYEGRDNLNPEKEHMARLTNRNMLKGSLSDALKGTDVFIGVSAPGVLKPEMVKSMNPDPIIFAMANPIPEIMPDEAKAAGAYIVATGRSDFPNQINNVLAFPGLFRGVLNSQCRNFTRKMFVAAAEAIANQVPTPTPDFIIPDPFDKEVPIAVSHAVVRVSKEFGCELEPDI
ncbi:MAG: NAD-dependent malic enzyme [Balneolales bacterium]|nr:NAD-dependent malic enzyme [Balneolales bacterium]